MSLPAIIIARGGSQRVPRKNVLAFCGRPLVEWSIIQAKASNSVTDVFLSTDDDEIADIGKRNNINVIRRPTMPHETPGDVPIHMAVKLLQSRGYQFEALVPLLPTSALRLPSDIDNAISLYWRYAKPIDSYVAGVIRTHVGNYYPQTDIHYANRIFNPYGKGKWYRFLETGSIVVQPADIFTKQECTKQTRSPKNWLYNWRNEKRLLKLYPTLVPYEMKFWQFFDIDTQEEFEHSELIFQKFILDKGYYKVNMSLGDTTYIENSLEVLLHIKEQ